MGKLDWDRILEVVTGEVYKQVMEGTGLEEETAAAVEEMHRRQRVQHKPYTMQLGHDGPVEDAAQEPAVDRSGLAAKLDAEMERQQAENALRHAREVYGANAPSPAPSPAPAAERESVAALAQELFKIAQTGESPVVPWFLGGDFQRCFLRVADYVIEREATLRKELSNASDSAMRLSAKLIDALAERDTLRARAEQAEAEVAALKSSEREQLIARMVSFYENKSSIPWLPPSTSAFVLYERARLKAQENQP